MSHRKCPDGSSFYCGSSRRKLVVDQGLFDHQIICEASAEQKLLISKCITPHYLNVVDLDP